MQQHNTLNLAVCILTPECSVLKICASSWTLTMMPYTDILHWSWCLTWCRYHSASTPQLIVLKLLPTTVTWHFWPSIHFCLLNFYTQNMLPNLAKGESNAEVHLQKKKKKMKNIHKVNFVFKVFQPIMKHNRDFSLNCGMPLPTM